MWTVGPQMLALCLREGLCWVLCLRCLLWSARLLSTLGQVLVALVVGLMRSVAVVVARLAAPSIAKIRSERACLISRVLFRLQEKRCVRLYNCFQIMFLCLSVCEVLPEVRCQMNFFFGLVFLMPFCLCGCFAEQLGKSLSIEKKVPLSSCFAAARASWCRWCRCS